MTSDELHQTLNRLRTLPAETEWVEFKEAKGAFDPEKLGEYFSALSNEANLKSQPHAWLIFGIEDKPPRRVVGTQYKSDRAALDVMKKQVADHASQRMTFIEIHELLLSEGRVLMFEIPPAPPGVPTAWKGHYYGRDGESIGALNPEEYERIRAQAVRQDWSAGLVEGASIADLDDAAIAFARAQFKRKHPTLTDESSWDTITFLNKAKVSINGKITRSALLLLGKPESSHFLSPAQPQVTWVLKGADGVERDYRHFGTPLILAGAELLKSVRNLTVRHLPAGTLFPEEVTQYDEWVVRETLHNCIAHQDYGAGTRINVVENEESLLFTNRGNFIPGTVEIMIAADAPPELYRNPFLSRAMVELNMIDTIGSGIKRMFRVQRERSFPLPDYDLSERHKVAVRLFGRIIDENYTRLLLARTDLDLADVMALDRVQKKKPIDDATFLRLKRTGLVAGRRPNLYVAAVVAALTDTKADFIRNRAFDKDHYSKMVVAYLEKFSEATANEFRALLSPKLSDVLSPDQKGRFIANMLQEMRRDGLIVAHGARQRARWSLTSPPSSSPISHDIPGGSG
jgi:ATP-dependent DNA helicase RecG